MKQSWQNRLLAMFLTVVMVIGLCPTYAFADDETDVQEAAVEEASVAPCRRNRDGRQCADNH